MHRAEYHPGPWKWRTPTAEEREQRLTSVLLPGATDGDYRLMSYAAVMYDALRDARDMLVWGSPARAHHVIDAALRQVEGRRYAGQ